MLAHMDDVLDLRRRKRVDVEGGVAFLEGSQQILVPLQRQRGMVATLHQDAGAPQFQSLLDLPEEDLLGVQVPLGHVSGKPPATARPPTLGAAWVNTSSRGPGAIPISAAIR